MTAEKDDGDGGSSMSNGGVGSDTDTDLGSDTADTDLGSDTADTDLGSDTADTDLGSATDDSLTAGMSGGSLGGDTGDSPTASTSDDGLEGGTGDSPTTGTSDSETDTVGGTGAAIPLSVLGIVLTGGSATALVAGVNHIGVPVGLGLGTLMLAVGVGSLSERGPDVPIVGSSTTSATEDSESWQLATFSLVTGVVLYSGGVVLLLSGVDDQRVQAAAGLGTLALAFGVYEVIRVYNEQSKRRHDELVDTIEDGHRDILWEIRDIDGFGSPLGPEAKQLLRTLRTQQELVEELQKSLDEQSGPMSELVEELSQRNEAIETVFEELFADGADPDSTGSTPGSDGTSDDDSDGNPSSTGD